MNLKCCLSVAYCNIDMILLRHAIFFISVSMFGSWSIYVLFMWSVFSLSFSFSLQLIIYNLIETENLFFGHVCQNFSLRVSLSFCLIFYQFQPGVAYKKKRVPSNCNWKKCTLMLTLNFQNCEKLMPWFADLPSKIPGYAPVDMPRFTNNLQLFKIKR